MAHVRYFSFPHCRTLPILRPRPKLRPPPLEGEFLHRLVCLENTPTRKWCISEQLSRKFNSFLCKLVIALNIATCRYVHVYTVARSSNYSYLQVQYMRQGTLCTNLIWILSNARLLWYLLMQNLHLYTFLIPTCSYFTHALYYWCFQELEGPRQ